MQDLKLTDQQRTIVNRLKISDMKITEQIAGHKIAGHENTGQCNLTGLSTLIVVIYRFLDWGTVSHFLR